MMNESPWGTIHGRHEMLPGVWQVTTAGHGGVMVERARVDALLSPAAQTIGKAWDAWLCFEEDGAWAVVAFEHPDAWAAGQDRSVLVQLTPAEVKQHAERVIRRWHPEYFAEAEAAGMI